MAEYDEFRLLISPEIGVGGAAARDWNLQILECTNTPALAGKKGRVTPCFTREQLRRLRSAGQFPDSDKLKEIGQCVWKSIANQDVAAALQASLAVAKNNNRGLRIVVVTIPEQVDADPNAIRLSELPVEAMRPDTYFAPSPTTPISRGLQVKPDAKPFELAPPLRVLVVMASPTDLPHADMGIEKAAIERALAPMVKTKMVIPEFLEGATRSRLVEYLERPFHVVHFIGHGAFDQVGDGPSTRAYLALVGDDGESDPLNGEDLDFFLRDTSVRLVVITACSSAAPTPDQEPYPFGAFDGIAQQLIKPASSVSAVVAMQFDMESEAAVAFSGALYRNLLDPGRTLDEAVALARKAIIARLSLGHRAWVTPTLYWRCQGGILFQIKEISRELDEETHKQIVDIDAQIEQLVRKIREAASQPANIRAALRPLIEQDQLKMEQLHTQRSLLLGSSLRLWGGRVKAGTVAACRLALKLQSAATIGTVKVNITFPQDKVAFIGAAAGAAGTQPGVDAPGGGAAGALQITIQNVSGGADWPEGEHELAVLNFKVLAAVTDPTVTLTLGQTMIEAAPNQRFSTLHGVLFVVENDVAAAAGP
jgi:hypothetical protein